MFMVHVVCLVMPVAFKYTDTKQICFNYSRKEQFTNAKTLVGFQLSVSVNHSVCACAHMCLHLEISWWHYCSMNYLRTDF